jgi:hypothetical protein
LDNAAIIERIKTDLLLCISLFQQRRPKLIACWRMTEHQLSILGRQKVVDDNVGPYTKPPKPEVEYSCVPRIPVLFFVINDNLKKLHHCLACD